MLYNITKVAVALQIQIERELLITLLIIENQIFIAMLNFIFNYTFQ
jgi:hypothetical protein